MFGVIPFQIVIFLVLAVLAYLLLHRTKYGRKIFLVGVNQQAAEYSGINSRWVIMSTYILSAVSAAVTGVILTSYLGTAKSDLGSGLGTALAAIAIGLLRFGMPLCFKINTQYLDIPIGVLLVVVVVGRSLASNPAVIAKVAKWRSGLKKDKAAAQ